MNKKQLARELTHVLKGLAEYPHTLDYEQEDRPIKPLREGARPTIGLTPKIGKGAKRPTEKTEIDINAILADKPDFQELWDLGFFDISPVVEYLPQREKNLLADNSLPDSHEHPSSFRADEEFLQVGVVNLAVDVTDQVKEAWDTEPSALEVILSDLGEIHVIGMVMGGETIKPRDYGVSPYGDMGTRKNTNIPGGKIPNRPVCPTGSSIKVPGHITQGIRQYRAKILSEKIAAWRTKEISWCESEIKIQQSRLSDYKARSFDTSKIEREIKRITKYRKSL